MPRWLSHVWDVAPEPAPVSAAPDPVIIDYCPDCEPARDPVRELLRVRWCHRHVPSDAGSADDAVTAGDGVLSNYECEGPTNKLWCDALHRRTA